MPGTFAARVIARIIDALVVTAIDLLLGSVLGFGYVWLVLGAVTVLAYFAVLDSVVGTTVGRRHETPRRRRRWRRPSLARCGAASRSCWWERKMPFVGPLVAIGLWIWFALRMRADVNGQGPHDGFAGGTRVVRT